MSPLISVNLSVSTYNVVISPNILTSIGKYLKLLNISRKILIISSPVIFANYGQIIISSLKRENFKVFFYLIPSGECNKTLDYINKIYTSVLNYKLERSSTLLALGGGMIGDMTGYVAATWLRGINFVQVPTSLLAMVDASIGGKTGVNYSQRKNLVGSFYHPHLVFIDPVVLRTLPIRELRAGMAEIVKYGLIWNRELFIQLEYEDTLNDLNTCDLETLQKVIVKSCLTKINIVNQDENEQGIRTILNYGHTIGHAIESLSKYNTVNHGEAVSIGMIAAGRIASFLGIWREDLRLRQEKLLQKMSLPTKIPDSLKIKDILESLTLDKKVKSEKVRFILPKNIGEVKVYDNIPSETIINALKSMYTF
ncbi:MAG: 3-dehydroquinate synthase [Candidatus Atelocyanobacterium thalassa]|uniref:3-dehydroquinate synthase n=1 Tax=Candidatus Atelocyanobacterium thalassa isolate SIO64986 TaxID=1527444 RepID=A0A086CG72_9CHRO|nr:MAG: 3-dehydroquinate synthase [Candidatus Atelocyanobacterium thalassa isolate SIO64986]